MDNPQNPTRICNGDRCVNVYEVEKDLTRASTTVVFTFSLSGMMCPPMLIYTHKIFEEIVVNQLVTELKKI
jgi:hypothetical protein